MFMERGVDESLPQLDLYVQPATVAATVVGQTCSAAAGLAARAHARVVQSRADGDWQW